MKKILFGLFITTIIFTFNLILTDFASAESLTQDDNLNENHLISPLNLGGPVLEGDGGAYGKIIFVDKHIKVQGYLTNAELKSYVKQVKNRAIGVSIMTETLSWLSLNPFIAASIGGVGVSSLFSNFDQISDNAANGNGMGWVHMYAAGPNTLSIIPRRDFYHAPILYVTQ